MQLVLLDFWVVYLQVVGYSTVECIRDKLLDWNGQFLIVWRLFLCTEC